MRVLPDGESTVMVAVKDQDAFLELEEFMKTRGVVMSVHPVRRLTNYARLLYALVWRDGTDCWLCGHPLDFTSGYKGDNGNGAPFGPSLDHVTPHSLGGTRDYENMKLAHKICNKARGNDVNWVSPLRGNELTPEKIAAIMEPWLRNVGNRKKKSKGNHGNQ